MRRVRKAAACDISRETLEAGHCAFGTEFSRKIIKSRILRNDSRSDCAAGLRKCLCGWTLQCRCESGVVASLRIWLCLIAVKWLPAAEFLARAKNKNNTGVKRQKLGRLWRGGRRKSLQGFGLHFWSRDWAGGIIGAVVLLRGAQKFGQEAGWAEVFGERGRLTYGNEGNEVKRAGAGATAVRSGDTYLLQNGGCGRAEAQKSPENKEKLRGAMHH